MSALLSTLVLLAAAQTAPAGTATLPLSELVPLLTVPSESQRSSPPALAVVVRSELGGRLGRETVQLKASIEVEVLDADRWSRLELFELGPDVFVDELPALSGATVAVLEGKLCFLGRQPGRYPFTFSLTLRGQPVGPARKAALRFGKNLAPIPLRLEADPSAYTLLEPKGAGTPEAPELFPRAGALELSWQANTAPAVARRTVRPALEPAVSRQTATFVSTLEGKATARVVYALRLDREQPLELELPEGHTLKRVTVNGALVAPPLEGRVLRLQVAPALPGETTAQVEVSLARDLGVFHLSGLLRLELPKVSWPVTELKARAHFPAVFNYHREGGSMEQTDVTPAGEDPGAFPLPGKVLEFQQFLVSASAPSLELRYSVNLTGSYFR